MERKSSGLIQQLQEFEHEFSRLDAKLLELDQKIERLVNIERNHLVRIKNNESVADDFILQGKPYYDLSPQKAWELYSKKDFDFILIDVRENDFTPDVVIPEALHFPWSDFQNKITEIQSKTTPILFISEDGTKSILACHFMSSRGFYNCNNISGGYKFWIGNKLNFKNIKSA